MLSKPLSDRLERGAKELGRQLSEEDIKRFILFMDKLKEWNKKFNLTAITRDDDIITKHFLDSLLLAGAFNFTTESVVDVGTGAGFPGIPLKISCPEIKLTLLDSVKKKTVFLEHIIKTLGLKNVHVLCLRAEDAAKTLRESFDISCARAVAPMRTLAEYCLPLTKQGGSFIALKEEKIEGEIKEAEKSFRILGGILKETKKIKVPGSDIVRSVVIIEKTGITPLKYPRKAGRAKKDPL